MSTTASPASPTVAFEAQYAAARAQFYANRWRAALDAVRPVRAAPPPLGVRAGMMEAVTLGLLTRADEARRAFRALGSRRRRFPAIDYYRGMFLLDQGQYLEALPAFEAVRGAPAAGASLHAHAASALNLVYAALGREQSAHAALRQVLDAGLVSPRILLFQGLRQLFEGELAAAQTSFLQALQSDHTEARGYVFLAGTLIRQGRYDVAWELLTGAAEIAPDDPLRALLEGDAARLAGRPQAALAAYEHARALAPRGRDADAALLQTARAWYELRSFDDARAGYERLRREFPRSPLAAQARAFAAALARPAAALGPTLIVTGFGRAVQRRDFCGPATIANLLAFWKIGVDQSAVAARVFARGTAWWRVRDFLHERGLCTRVFGADRALVTRLIERGLPLLAAEHHGGEGHLVALIGVDEPRAAYLVQDPGAHEPQVVPWRSFDRAWRHEEQLALLAVPAAREDLLVGLDLPDPQPYEAWIEATRARDREAPARALRVAEVFCREAPRFLPARRLLAQCALLAGQPAAARAACAGALALRPRPFWAARYAGDAWLIEYRNAHAAGGPALPGGAEDGAGGAAPSGRPAAAPGAADDALARAQAAYRQARRRAPRDAETLALLAETCRLRGEQREARRLFAAALALDPRLRFAHAQRGVLEQEAGRRTAAIFHLRAAYELGGPDEDLHRRLVALGDELPDWLTAEAPDPVAPPPVDGTATEASEDDPFFDEDDPDESERDGHPEGAESGAPERGAEE